LHLQGLVDTTGDPTLAKEVFHAIRVILILNLGDHKGLTLFIQSWLLKRTLLIFLPAIQIPLREFLSPVSVHC